MNCKAGDVLFEFLTEKIGSGPCWRVGRAWSPA